MAVPDRLPGRRRFLAVPASARLAGYLVVGLLLRLLLFAHFPALLTNDSPDYIRAGVELFWLGNFDSFSLRDVRMPGYPLFLAALYPLTGVRSDLLVLAQMTLGLLCIPLGWSIGRRLRSQPVADALALFFALNPVYLLLEHALMSETLALFAMLAFTLLVLAGFWRPPAPLLGFSAAALLGFCTLIRVNLLPYGAVLLACMAARWLYLAWLQPPRTRVTGRTTGRIAGQIAVLLPILLGLAVTLGPWLWRNYATYHTLALSGHSARSLLVWKTMSGTMDPTLPLYQDYSFGHALLGFEWLWELDRRYPPPAAEVIAAAIVGEQIYAHPDHHRWAVAASALSHAGIYLGGALPRDDRAMVAFWFSTLVANPAAVESSVQRVSEWLDFYPITRPSPWTALWSRAGMLFLQVARPLLVLGFVGASLVFAWRARRGSYRVTAPVVQAVAALVLAYYATLLFHTLTLTGSDRFASISDWVALLVLVFVIGHQHDPVRIQRHPYALTRAG
jgi:hypothetical protein